MLHLLRLGAVSKAQQVERNCAVTGGLQRGYLRTKQHGKRRAAWAVPSDNPGAGCIHPAEGRACASHMVWSEGKPWRNSAAGFSASPESNTSSSWPPTLIFTMMAKRDGLHVETEL